MSRRCRLRTELQQSLAADKRGSCCSSYLEQLRSGCCGDQAGCPATGRERSCRSSRSRMLAKDGPMFARDAVAEPGIGHEPIWTDPGPRSRPASRLRVRSATRCTPRAGGLMLDPRRTSTSRLADHFEPFDTSFGHLFVRFSGVRAAAGLGSGFGCTSAAKTRWTLATKDNRREANSISAACDRPAFADR